ncbi:MAG: N-acetylmuramoyl-L-alanine amidase, partial [Chlorobi bacterium]|nr:N-acetylmuramoyl-L-alanine amidase [Chlorobiota bacterium]
VKSSGLSRDVRSNDLLLALYTPAEVQKIYAEEKQQRENAADRSRWKLDCIVIDPGHGGKDPGAIGVSGVKEKNVALGIALKLGKLIKKNMPGVRVVFTRKDDRFIELDKRGQIANKNMGKLFISIHCNTMPKKPSPVRGFESYLLRPGRTDEAIRIAEFENSVIKLEKDYQKRYAKLTPENFILVNMAQSAYMHFSEQFAELLHKEIKENGPLTSRGVKQAGLFVLVGASMPGILIESGFLSNPEEEKFLASNRGQQEIANRLFAAIKKYAKGYSKDLKK